MEKMQVSNQRYRLGYHVMAPAGWINDPNGFVYFKGQYHIFYQHYPYSAEWGPMHWGHAVSDDLVHWQTLPIALAPEDPMTENGVFSGSAIVKDDKLYLMYTGHHFFGDGDADHFFEDQNLAVSEDGVHFTKYEHNPVIQTKPMGNSDHFRDPKVWQEGDTYYVVLGGQNEQTKVGRVLLYSSKDLLTWSYEGVIAEAKAAATEGYMWECPDIFNIDGQDVLLMSPQGMQPDGEDNLNLHQTGYMIGHLDVNQAKFKHNHFVELDRGHDFYATQTMLAPDGRRIVLAWMAMWESDMPEQADGWAGALTFPRELSLKNDHLYMQPVAELKQLYSGDTQSNMYDDATQPVTVLSEAHSHDVHLKLPATSDFKLAFNTANEDALTIQYEAAANKFTVSRADRPDKRYGYITATADLTLQLLVDKSSVELFINNGELVFTERYYVETAPDMVLQTVQTVAVQAQVTELAQDVIKF